jgi:hypothetical protein
MLANIKMKTLLIIISIITTLRIIAQEEYKIHIKSIRETTNRPPSPSSILKDTTLLDYAINKIIKPTDIIYISNRQLLQRFTIDTCSIWNIEMTDTINDTSKIEIKIKTRAFDPETNIIEKYKQEEYKDYTENINGMYAYGATYKLPEIEFSSLEILVNGVSIEIPDSAYKNLYEPQLCQSDRFSKGVAAYTSLDGKFIYLYIYGGNAAGTYFTKLIFDHKQFITKWTIEYGVLSVFSCFHPRFIGY